MSELIETQLDESNADLNLDEYEIAELRAFAKIARITTQRDWKKQDFINALKAKQEADKYALAAQSLSSDGSLKTPLKPGEARLIIHRDPTPGHSNSHVPLGLNGRIFLAPRGVELVLPFEYVEVLANAVVRTMRQKKEPTASSPEGEVVEEPVLSYPYQVLEFRPGGKGFVSNMDQRGVMARRKEAFRAEMHQFPQTVAELTSWEQRKRQDELEDRKDARQAAEIASVKAK